MRMDPGVNPLTLLPEAITRVAERHPDHPALRFAGTQMSYGELDDRSNRFANFLLSSGVAKGDRIGLYAHKSLEVVVALHGIMKAGAAYVPVNPDAPAAYVRHILEDCEITRLVVGKTTAKTAATLAPAVGLESLIGIAAVPGDVATVTWEEVDTHPSHHPKVPLSGDDLAYIIFTSGSTGRPKGIMHTHRSGLAYGEVAAATYGFRAEDRIANHAPLNFDLSLLELFGAIVVGATIVVIPEAHARLPASFSKLLMDERVTVINAVPFALVQLLHRGGLDHRDLSEIRWVLFGGEVFPTKDLRALMRCLPGARFANVYGPAEVNGVTYHLVPALADDANEPIPIGRLYPGMKAMVVDENDQQVEVGTTGELLINSPTHMVGYWRQPELTARSTYERQGSSGQERWHRTGDLVELREDGLFRLVGRKDRMVKIRGHRVELDEIETVLMSHELVEQAVVYAVPDGEGSQRVEAAVILVDTPAGSGEPSAVSDGAATDLRRFAGRSLPRYAVPENVRLVSSVPRTSTGKADRVTLLREALERSERQAAQ